MKLVDVALATAFFALAVAPQTGAAASIGYSDLLCPEATSKVVAVQGLTTAADPAKILAVAKDAEDTYDVCAQRKLGDQDVEPGAHYAFTREAQFGVLAARAMIAQKRVDEARRELLRDRSLAADVASWQVSTHGTDPNVRVPSDSRYSRYHDTAQAVVDAANAELKRLGDSPSPSAPSPAPHR